ncbi:MAG: hypothetical protein K2M82_07705, partial [Lachnospiraceae bacterium]|nr:hypothetical protein [Lachnospiraceae bacterium]
MKKLSFISLSSLLVAVILTTVGVAMINKSDLNFGDVYDRFDENIPIVQTNSDYSRAEDTNLTEIGNMSEDEYATYQLNEFNTLCIMADGCTVKTVLTASDDMVISLDRVQKAVGHMTLQTAIKGGNLYAKFMWYGEPTASVDEVTLTVGIPENYKGGYKISAADSVLEIDEIESTMDIS